MKLAYKKFSEQESTIPLFSQPWWLDLVCGEETWDVALVKRGQEIVASMPYFTKKRGCFRYLTQPPLTQHLGPWIKVSTAKCAKQLGQQKDIMQALIAQLPKYDMFAQNWSYRHSNWLPFYWKGFSQTTRYTYVLEDLTDLDTIWSGINSNIESDIRKSESRYALTIQEDLPASDFVALNKGTFTRQGKSLPYGEAWVTRFIEEVCARGCGKTFIAVDEAGQHHAGVFIVWDQNSAYYLMGGGDPKLRNSGATSLCMWHAIQFAATVTKKFDFEGSMLEPVERFFRGFGAKQKPYFCISKTPSRILRLYQVCRNMRT